MKAYKGFNSDGACRGMLFEEGKTYHEDKAALCKCGFHACEAPIDVFGYYPPATSIYREVELEDVTDQHEDDSKRTGKTITIGAKLDISEISKAQVEYVKSNCTNVQKANCDGAATAGYCGTATAGYLGAATAGERGAATAGYSGAATSRGASTVGEGGIACAKGNRVKVRGGIGALLVIAEEDEDDYEISIWKAVVVDGKEIKPNTWYGFRNSVFGEVD